MAAESLIAQATSFLIQFLQERRGRKQRRRDEVRRDWEEWCARQRHTDVMRELSSAHGLMSHLTDAVDSLVGASEQLDSDALRSHVRRELERRLPGLKSPADWFSETAARNRPHRNLPLIGRVQEWRKAQEMLGSDFLVVGQPGSGKSFFVERFIEANNGLFLRSHNEEIPDGILDAVHPQIVVIDDAGDRCRDIRRLIEYRLRSQSDFSIIAICWPFESERVLAWIVTIWSLSLVRSD
jgi:hypothetical protein